MVMDSHRNAITTLILLFLIIADVSSASSSFWKLRYLADESPLKNNTIATTSTPPKSPSPNPLSSSGDKKLDPILDNSTKLDPNSFNNKDSVTPPLDYKKDPKPSGNKPEKVNGFPQKEINGENTSSLVSNPKNDKTIEGNEEKKKNADSGKNPNATNTQKGGYTNEDKETKKQKKKKPHVDENNSKSVIAETCDGVVSRCEDRSSLTACIKGFGTGSKEVVILVHNSGEKTLNVNLVSPFGVSIPKTLKIPKYGTEKINIIFAVRKPSELTLTAGNGDCKIPLIPLASEGNFLSKLPSYDNLLTPVNSAYFLIVVVVIFGGSWACCTFCKRRRHDDGIPYQELEMGLPESMAGTEVETAEGWDQVWDDDWDDDTAVKSPLGRNVANISANGLTARSSNRDGWEDDWDD